MYLEFIILIVDYFKSLNKRLVIYEILVPLFIGFIVYQLLKQGTSMTSCVKFRDNSLTVLGILVGFSITIITILTTSNSRNIEAIKLKKTNVKIGNHEISLFRLLLINFTYSVVIEIFLIIINLVSPIILENYHLQLGFTIFGFSIVVFLVIHVLLLTIRNLTEFYLIITK